MNKLRIRWQETYEEKIDIQDIINYADKNDYYISTPMFARTVVKEYLIKNGKYNINTYTEKMIDTLGRILLETIEEQKITIKDIENKIHEFKSFIVKNLLSSTYDTSIDEKIQDLLDTIEEYKYQN